MAFFRSERMCFCRLILHQEYAFDCLVELGYVGKAQFVHIDDLDHKPNNKFVHEIQRCGEVERIAQHLQEEINKVGMHTVYYEEADKRRPKPSDLPDIELALQNLEAELSDVQSRCDELQKRQLSLYEHEEVLKKLDAFPLSGSITNISTGDSMTRVLLKDSSTGELGLRTAHDVVSPVFIITGSIPVERFSPFEVMVWRVSRGNAYVNHVEFELPAELAARCEQHRYKYAFMVAVVGEQLRQKVTKVCQGFQARIYNYAGTTSQRWRDLTQIKVDLNNLKLIFEKSCQHKKRVLAVASGDLFIWRAKITKMRDVYDLMNRFDIVSESKQQYFKYLKSDCWIPRGEVHAVRAALTRGSRVAAGDWRTLTFPPLLMLRNSHPSDLRPPTYFRTNKFTDGFQHLVDAYGMASYRELNPAPYTIVTFPFLFAVMFGDVGHGVLMALFAFYLVWREKKIQLLQKEALHSNEIFDLLFAGRYIILLMGLFSIYTGFIYNDMLSKGLNLFGSSWHVNMTLQEFYAHKKKELTLNPANPMHYRGTPYIFGLDPMWDRISENSIIVNNSLKMKVAIILGVLQMIFGLTLSAGNALFFRSKIDLYLVFVPQLVFLTCLFFYLVVLIFHKWAFFGGHIQGQFGASCAPSILITFINMILMKRDEEPPAGCNASMYTGQFYLQRVLLFIALLTVPILLCGKPFHFMYQHRRIKAISDPEHRAEIRRNTLSSLRKSLIYNVEFVESDPHMVRQETEEKLSEIWIHQGIHTIECVLGSISHSASYLRLWALSLAHSQLSHVLWSMVLSNGLHSKRGYFNAIVLFFSFSAFAVLTVSILVVMEGLSAFLHALRLHWVEFQSKFYGGLGEQFLPFRFRESRRRDSST